MIQVNKKGLVYMKKIILRLFVIFIRFIANLITLFMIFGLVIRAINLFCGFASSLDYVFSMIIIGLISFLINVWATSYLEFNDF